MLSMNFAVCIKRLLCCGGHVRKPLARLLLNVFKHVIAKIDNLT